MHAAPMRSMVSLLWAQIYSFDIDFQISHPWQSYRQTFSRNKTGVGLFLEPGARQSLCKIMATVPLSRSAVKKPDPALSSCKAVVYRSPGTG